MENWTGEPEDKDAQELRGLEIDGFEWDAGKNASNQAKHGVSFEEAEEAFEAPESLMGPTKVREEKRWTLVGASHSGRPLVVIFTMREQTARIISARRHKP
ncbi:MAG: BrnT family toxin [Candidatus Xenobia bacterium]